MFAGNAVVWASIFFFLHYINTLYNQYITSVRMEDVKDDGCSHAASAACAAAAVSVNDLFSTLVPKKRCDVKAADQALQACMDAYNDEVVKAIERALREVLEKAEVPAADAPVDHIYRVAAASVKVSGVAPDGVSHTGTMSVKWNRRLGNTLEITVTVASDAGLLARLSAFFPAAWTIKHLSVDQRATAFKNRTFIIVEH